MTNLSTPTSINDLIFGNEESRTRILDIVEGKEIIPSHSLSGILIYGIYGTGKTTLAQLLPDAIERAKTHDDQAEPYVNFYECQRKTIAQDMLTIASQSNFYPHNQSLHYFIIDEVDRLNKEQQMDLRGIMNKSNALFILTTNNPSLLDLGLTNRCVKIEMNAASAEKILPLAKQMLSGIDVDLSDAELLNLIPTYQGSIRAIAHEIPAYARKKLYEQLKAA